MQLSERFATLPRWSANRVVLVLFRSIPAFAADVLADAEYGKRSSLLTFREKRTGSKWAR
jgi:hypothetical protein